MPGRLLREPVWMAPEADPAVKVDDDAVTVISPFDSLVWTRERQERLFGKDYRLEAKAAAKRTFGYFSLPIVRGPDIVGGWRCGVAARRWRSRTPKWTPAFLRPPSTG